MADKVNRMGDHLAKGARLLREYGQPVEPLSQTAAPIYPLKVTF
jgi:hypothetical protein